MSSTSATDHRQAAARRVADLLALLRGQANAAGHARLMDEAEALGRAIAAFHLEGIRFRMYNVDRLITHGDTPVPPEANAIFADIRRHLEAAGFHTRSHHAPG
jgi:hypothetical protein